MAKTEETREMPSAIASGPSSQSTGTVEMLPPEKAATAATATREMPRFAVPPTQGPPPPVTTEQVVRLERKGSAATPPTLSTAVPAMRPEPPKQAAAKVPAPKSAQKPSPKLHPKSGARGSGRTGGSEPPPSVSDDAVESVIADAVRLMQWGRKWYELAELISRMADRPGLPDVRRILKDRKSEIEKLAGR
jgi:hypothetical protein